MKSLKQGILGAFALLFASALRTFGQNAIQFTAISATAEQAIRLSWASNTNELYRIDYADSIIDTNTGSTTWNTLCDEYPSHGTNTFYLDTGDYFQTPPILHPKYDAMRFYRIVNEGTNLGPAPTVIITSPSTGVVATGSLSIAVSASTDQATLSTKLYVDGQLMPMTFDSTNWTDGSSNYVTANYVINTCEWLNGPHVLFAVAECASDFSGPPLAPPVLIGRAVSPYVPMTFSNLISGFSWSEAFFQPVLSQTQTVSAIFAANVNWTLQMRNASSNAVRTVTGSGTSMHFNWDGTGTGGTNLPAGVYYYLLTAQTNGQSSPNGFGQNSGNESTGPPSTAGSGTTAPSISSSGSESTTSTNLAAVRARILAYIREHGSSLSVTNGAATSSSNAAEDGFASPEYSGPQSESTQGPTRPPIAPVAGAAGTFAVGYQTYLSFEPTIGSQQPAPVCVPPPLDCLPFNSHVSIEGLPASESACYPSMPHRGGQALNFEYQMRQGGWNELYDKHANNLVPYDLIGSSTFFNQANLGLLLLHGARGTSPDY